MAEQRSSSAPFAMSASTPAVAAAPTPAPIPATCAAVPPTPALPSDNEEDPTGFLDELFHEFDEFNERIVSNIIVEILIDSRNNFLLDLT